MLVITPIYIGLLGLLFIFLSFKVISNRRRLKIAIGNGGNEQMLRAMRVQANFTEYVPVTMVCLVMLELNQVNAALLHGLCLLLVIGRLLHAYGVSQMPEPFKLRVVGMVMTFTALAIAAITNLVIVFL